MKRHAKVLLCLLLLVAAVRIHSSGADAAGGKLIALTFDDGPGRPTDGLLDGLKERGIRATFFMLGNCAERYPSVVTRAYGEGHQIAGHSWSHANMIYLTGREVSQEFYRTNEVLTKSVGRRLNYLARVPYGNYNDSVRSAVGMPIIGWTVDPLDWKYRDAETVRRNIVSAAFDGAIILVHDIHPTSVDGALRAADDLAASGYEFVTVRELFRRRGVELQNGVVYRSAPPNGIDKGPVAAPVIGTDRTGGALTVTVIAGDGAEIWCTLDGSDPALGGWKYTGPFQARTGMTVRAVAAYDLNGSRSGEVSVTLAHPQAAPPVLTVKNGRLILQSDDPGTELYYTLDGSPADRNGIRYGTPVALEPGTTIRARACACEGEGEDEWLDSEETGGWYSPGGHFFRDVEAGDWFAQAVDMVYGAGWLMGIGNDCFSPASPLFRGQLAAILHRMAGKPEPAESLDFPDVRETDYFLSAARWAVSAGIAECGKDGGFSPGGTVSRETLAVMLYRYLVLTGEETGKGDPARFRDGDEIAPSAKEAVGAVGSFGILVGDTEGFFHPRDPLTRAQIAVILTRMLPVGGE